ncbi:MAG: YlmC/YmxH family sporulation protein [Clostridiaceae bacterium]
MDEDIKLYSDMERYEIININDGEKYDYLGNNDIIIDEEGNLKLLILSEPNVKLSFFSKSDFIEVPWEYVKKIGSRTIIIDVDERSLKRTRI